MNKRIAIVGPGAIGTTIAAALQQVGQAPMLCGRSARERLELQDTNGLVQIPGPVQIDPSQIKSPADLVFFAVKATQIGAAAPWLAALCHQDTVVCVLQNGVEQVSAISPLAPCRSVVPSIVWFPAQAQPDGSIWLRGGARLTLPEDSGSRIVLEALRGSFCSVELDPNFVSLAWRKLLQNAAAGLMVLSGRRSGMFRRADIAHLATQYLRECLEVARAEGAILGDEVPDEIVDSFQANPPDMGTSILADRNANRPLEWQTRNGVILRRGKAHGIATPVSDVVVALLAAASDGPG
ncbi:oxidoreductase [Bradyrhizobium arachidis]|uniref:2-dehydropantoate 2-reductase n=1 Tax=Bradyrhizobium arachidis TaxID=858423 RepID=A0AAE7TLN5_9BRAD|nr:oxidoreductase [Bradyrhizobium arachidis]QOZ72579.1 oxidoreductase [Bradyrhizobium arachidis]SFU90272.1 ketopantoate reductase [Bradyrhizobium arachidis]